MKTKSWIAAIGLSFLLGSSSCYAADWLASFAAQFTGRLIGRAVAGCTEMLMSSVASSFKSQPEGTLSKPSKFDVLTFMDEESLLQFQTLNPPDYADVFRLGDAVVMAEGKVFIFRSDNAIEILRPRVERLLVNARLLTDEQLKKIREQ